MFLNSLPRSVLILVERGLATSGTIPPKIPSSILQTFKSFQWLNENPFHNHDSNWDFQAATPQLWSHFHQQQSGDKHFPVHLKTPFLGAERVVMHKVALAELYSLHPTHHLRLQSLVGNFCSFKICKLCNRMYDKLHHLENHLTRPRGWDKYWKLRQEWKQ